MVTITRPIRSFPHWSTPPSEPVNHHSTTHTLRWKLDPRKEKDVLKRKLAAIAGITLTLTTLLGTPAVAHADDNTDPDPKLHHTSTGEEFRGFSYYLCKHLGIFCRK
jgi:hypothetical protein